MKYYPFIIALFFSSIYCFAKNIETPIAVKTFINNLEKLSTLSDDEQTRSEEWNIRQENINLFFTIKNEQGAPLTGITIDTDNMWVSELPHIGLGTVPSSTTYCNMLHDLIYTKRELKLRHEILYTVVASKMPGINGKDEPYIYATTMKKTCSYKNTDFVFWQKFEVCATNGKIVKVNGFTEEPSRQTDDNEPIGTINKDSADCAIPAVPNPVHKIPVPSEMDLMKLAARYYTIQDYTKAADVFATITEKYPDNAEAWFRLALMVKYKNKWSKQNFSNPKEEAIKYMRKAYSLATGDLKTKAENTLYRWEHPRYM